MKIKPLSIDIIGSTSLLYDSCEDPDYPEETKFTTGVIPTLSGFVWVFQDKTWVILEFIHNGFSYTKQLNGKFSTAQIAILALAFIEEIKSL